MQQSPTFLALRSGSGRRRGRGDGGPLLMQVEQLLPMRLRAACVAQFRMDHGPGVGDSLSSGITFKDLALNRGLSLWSLPTIRFCDSTDQERIEKIKLESETLQVL